MLVVALTLLDNITQIVAHEFVGSRFLPEDEELGNGKVSNRE